MINAQLSGKKLRYIKRDKHYIVRDLITCLARSIGWRVLFILPHMGFQALRESEDGAHDAIDDEADDGGDDDHHERRDERGDDLDLLVEFALIHIGDHLHGAAKSPGLLADGHHVDEQYGENLLLGEGDGEGGSIDDGLADLDHAEAHMLIAGDFLEQFEGAQEGDTVFHKRPESAGKLGVKAEADDAAVERDAPCEVVPGAAALGAGGEGFPPAVAEPEDEDAGPPVVDDDPVGIHEQTGGGGCSDLHRHERQWGDDGLRCAG